MIPEPIPATGDAYAGGYSFTVNGAPLRAQSLLSPHQFAGIASGADPYTYPMGVNATAGNGVY